MDNFPFTADIHTDVSRHVECVCLLNNKNAKLKEYVEIGVDVEDYYRIKDSEKQTGQYEK